MASEAVNTMRIFRRQRAKEQEDELAAIHKETFKSIDRATQSFDRNSASLDKLNKILEEKGDVAYNIFMATGGRKRLKR